LECANANFENAIIDDKRYLKQLIDGKAKNVPAVVKSKTELREKLEKTEWYMYSESILSVYFARLTYKIGICCKCTDSNLSNSVYIVFSGWFPTGIYCNI
jgi:hypothetical protein